MKEISELQFPDNFFYSKEHEWAKSEGDKVRVGISDYAQDQLGDIVFVELPQIGSRYAKGEQFGTIESVKTVSELYMPLGGEILSVNKAMEGSPEIVNTQPYESGWMIEIKPSDPGELKGLMNREAYLGFLKGLKP
jgi:glycine cleavage system H protein